MVGHAHFRCQCALVSLFRPYAMPVGQVHIIGVDDWSWRRGKLL